ncbi:MAG: lipocalin family protein [Gemmatimonadetes bacterium]|nr:lipocalin family protein [Gemmatimonadota bacterium]
MKALRTLTAAMLTVAVIGCSDATTVEDVADLVGTWNAASFLFVSDADPNVTFELIAEGGSFTLVIAADGSYTGNFAMGTEVETFSGTITISGSNLVITDDLDPEDTSTVAFELNGNTLTMTDSDESFDFDDDGVEEDADSVMVLERQ